MINYLEYYKLIDIENSGTIVRSDSTGKQFRFDPITKKWINTGILLQYFSEWDPLYDLVEEITEQEAAQLIGKENL